MNTLYRILFVIVCTNVYILRADISHGILEKYKRNNVFVCVGIYSCVNLARALNAGFSEIHGIDEDEVLVKHGNIIFPKDINENPFNITNYHIHHGGLEFFAHLINSINKPMTILLGSHHPNMDQQATNNILQELEVIQNHPIKNHIILIDFINYAFTSAFGNVSLDDIKMKLLEINPRYTFFLEKGGRLEKEDNAVLVAILNKQIIP